MEGPQPGPITVKFSGDGAVIAASASMVFLTFSFPGLSENVLSAAGMCKVNNAKSSCKLTSFFVHVLKVTTHLHQ